MLRLQEANDEQTRNFAKLRYLAYLRTQQSHQCPICLSLLTDSWMIYPCMHFVCIRCFNRLSRRVSQHAAELLRLQEANDEQTRNFAKLRYLAYLRTQQSHQCPICLSLLTDSWMIYPCMHFVCIRCFNRLSRR
ncbi:unnamed protein product [Gongylonema pulchrum]|uniref:RING-type domain-containing protein n=1 Tax=Gongylonema pulchrum TaxID=637853 RepID=A0A3P7MVS9_9BILA|nr:unnamed protein product [Gongylonema pulchrum]